MHKTAFAVTVAMTVLALAPACGGKPKKMQGYDGDDMVQRDPGAPPENADMVPMEQVDEIQRRLDRKRDSVSRCLSVAVDAKELPKNAHGKITVSLTVKPSGHAEAIKIINSSLESQSLHDCVMAKIGEIAFPEVTRDFETSYTYGFETN